jgi:WD40 repeat protein
MFFRALLTIAAFVFLASPQDAQTADKPRTDALGDPLPDGAIARLGTLRLKHAPATGATIDGALVSPDGSKIVTIVSSAGSIHVWDAASGKEIPGPWKSNFRYSTLAFSPDSKLLAAAVNPGFRPTRPGIKKIARDTTLQDTVVLYDIAKAGQVKTLSGPSQHVNALAFADGGKTLVAAGDGAVRWWDVETGKEKQAWEPFAGEQPKVEGNVQRTKTFTFCALSPDAKAIALQVEWRGPDNRQIFYRGMAEASIDKEAIGYDLAARKKSWQTSGKGGRYEKGLLTFSADGKRVALALGADKIEVRDVRTGKLICNPLDTKLPGNSGLGGLALSADGGTLAWASKDSIVHFMKTKPEERDAAPGQLAARTARNGPFSTSCLEFSADGNRLLVGVDADLQVYDMATGREVHPWEGHRGWVEHLAFTPDGKRLLTGSAGSDVSRGDYFGPNGEVYFLVMGNSWAVPSPEQAAWDVATWKRAELTSARASAWPNFANASLQQTHYVGKTGDDRFALFDNKTGQLVARMRVPDKQLTPGTGFFSPAGKHYVQYARDNRGETTERLYRVPSGKLVCQMPPLSPNRNRPAFLSQAPADSGNNLAFSPDERLVAQFGRGDGRIHVYDTDTGKLRFSLGTKLEMEEGRINVFSHDAAFSFDNKYLASWSSMEKVIRVWDTATGAELVQIVPEEIRTQPTPGFLAGQRRLNLAWSPDNRVLAVAENTIRLYEMATLGVRRTLPGHQDAAIRAVAFAPGGHVLASASSDTTVLIWDMIQSNPTPAEKTLDRASLEKRWQSLAENSAALGLAAMLELAAAPKEGLPFIRERIKPAIVIAPERIGKLIEDLNDVQFKVRQSATNELVQLGDRVVPALDKALATKPALETHLRLQEVRKRVTGPVLKSDKLREYRVLEVLERMGTPEARELLETLAAGAPGAMVTTQAGKALERAKGR